MCENLYNFAASLVVGTKHKKLHPYLNSKGVGTLSAETLEFVFDAI